MIKKISSNRFNENFQIKQEPVLHEMFNKKLTTENTSNVYIGFGTVIQGHLDVPGEVIVNGTFKGTIKANQLTIEENGYVSGHIKAERIITYGRIDQEFISTEFIHIHASGRVNGNLSYYDIKIEKGGKLEGPLKRINQVNDNLIEA